MAMKHRAKPTNMSESIGDVVYELWYEREYEDREDTELFIGIYRTEADAKGAIERLRDKPGFRDWPEGFIISEARLNEDGWAEGFVTVKIAAKSESGEAFDIPAERHA